jgi:hypothetical protein
MLRSLLTLLIIFSVDACWGQESPKASTLSFLVCDSLSHQALGGAVCRVYSNGKMAAYALADNDGKLSVKAGRNDMLEFYALGYKKRKMRASAFDNSKRQYVGLAQTGVALREITVKAPAIRAKGDTLVYDVRTFAKAGDTYLEDVLKKLPGINVADNGTVSYQGKAINKFYIEGKDLLGNSYNQATRNMPVGAVRSVEVMENHQPVKVLQGKQVSDKAALNIKLDKGHLARPFGEVAGGIGSGQGTVWDNSLFLTQVLGGSQLMVTGKMNNSGKDLSEETQEHIDVTNLDAYEPIPASLLRGTDFQESLPVNRYATNKSYSGGLNYLVNLSPDATLRLNMLAYEDRSGYSSLYDYTYGGMTTTQLREENRLSRRTLTLLPIIRYELNAKKMFLSNELRYSYNNYDVTNRLTSNDKDIQERVHGRPAYLQNYLTAAFTWGQNAIQVKSLTRYYDRHERLRCFADSVQDYNVEEPLAVRSWISKNILSTSFPLWGRYLEVRALVNYAYHQYVAEGTVQRRRITYQLQPSYTISWGTDRYLTLEMPVGWLHASIDAQDKKTREMPVFCPALRFKYALSPHWKVRWSVDMNKSDASGSFYALLPVRTSYRAWYESSNQLFFSKSNSLTGGIYYQDLVTMLFCNVSASYSDERHEYYRNDEYTASKTVVTDIAGRHHQRTLLANADVSKSFTDAGLTLKTQLSYSLSSYPLSQSGVVTNNRSHIFSLGVNTSWQKLSWLRLNLSVTGFLYWERSDYEHSDVLSSLKGKSSVFFFPSKRWDIRLKCQSVINEVAPSDYKNCHLFDAEASYKISKRLEAKGSVENLLNEQDYTIRQNTGLNTIYTRLPLRGRVALVKLLLHL